MKDTNDNESVVLKSLSDEEVARRSRTVSYGEEAQREAMTEARRRGIFDPIAHLKASPIGQAFEEGLKPAINKNKDSD